MLCAGLLAPHTLRPQVSLCQHRVTVAGCLRSRTRRGREACAERAPLAAGINQSAIDVRGNPRMLFEVRMDWFLPVAVERVDRVS
jgi:hypothetical protein